MTKHHAKHKKHHENSTAEEAGFLSFNFKKLMNRRDKFLIIGIVLGVVVLFAATAYLLLGGKQEVEEIADTKDPAVVQKIVNEKIDEMKSEAKEATILINSRTINPLVTTIKVGGNVGFLNEQDTQVTIQGYDRASEILNIGPVEPYDIPVVVFDKAGSYKFINPQNPSEVGEIVVTE